MKHYLQILIALTLVTPAFAQSCPVLNRDCPSPNWMEDQANVQNPNTQKSGASDVRLPVFPPGFLVVNPPSPHSPENPLGLSDEQKVKIATILVLNQANVKQTLAEVKLKMDSLRNTLEAQIKPVLDRKQQAIFDYLKTIRAADEKLERELAQCE